MNRTINTSLLLLFSLYICKYVYIFVFVRKCSSVERFLTVQTSERLFHGVKPVHFGKQRKYSRGYILSKVRSVIIHTDVSMASAPVCFICNYSPGSPCQQPCPNRPTTVSLLPILYSAASLSLSPSLFYAPFSFAGQPPLFQPTSLWSVVQVNSRETCIKPPWTPFKRAFLTCHCWPGGRGKFLHLSTSSPLPAIHNFEVGFFLPRVITRYFKNWRICWSLFGKKLASIRQGIFEKFLFQKFWISRRNSGESAY